MENNATANENANANSVTLDPYKEDSKRHLKLHSGQFSRTNATNNVTMHPLSQAI